MRPEKRDSNSATDPQQSARFRLWFGDSQVVSESGEPLVVYHGTPNSFSEFLDKQHTDRSGNYFTSDPEFALSYAEDAAMGIEYEPDEEALGPSVMPVYLAIRNPLDVRKGWPENIALELEDIWMPEWLTTWPPSDYWNALDGPEGEAVVLRLQKLGYDGLIATEARSPVWVAFRAKQIKSAIGNSGLYDPTSADICDSRRELSASLEQPYKARWETEDDSGFAPG